MLRQAKFLACFSGIFSLNFWLVDMLEITREHVIAMAHRLYDYNGCCERLHGHNYRIAVTLAANKLNHHGMIADFALLKEVLFGALDNAWDHRTLLFERDPLCASLAKLDDGSLCVVGFNPTAENMAAYLGEKFFPAVMRDAALPADLRVVAVAVYETDKNYAKWSSETT